MKDAASPIRQSDGLQQDFYGPIHHIFDDDEIVVPERDRFIGLAIQLERVIQRALDVDPAPIRVIANEPNLVEAHEL
jgi:hypothetical protein